MAATWNHLDPTVLPWAAEEADHWTQFWAISNYWLLSFLFRNSWVMPTVSLACCSLQGEYVGDFFVKPQASPLNSFMWQNMIKSQKSREEVLPAPITMFYVTIRQTQHNFLYTGEADTKWNSSTCAACMRYYKLHSCGFLICLELIFKLLNYISSDHNVYTVYL